MIGRIGIWVSDDCHKLSKYFNSLQKVNGCRAGVEPADDPASSAHRGHAWRSSAHRADPSRGAANGAGGGPRVGAGECHGLRQWCWWLARRRLTRRRHKSRQGSSSGGRYRVNPMMGRGRLASAGAIRPRPAAVGHVDGARVSSGDLGYRVALLRFAPLHFTSPLCSAAPLVITVFRRLVPDRPRLSPTVIDWRLLTLPPDWRRGRGGAW
jgi:hypothetical protein